MDPRLAIDRAALLGPLPLEHGRLDDLVPAPGHGTHLVEAPSRELHPQLEVARGGARLDDEVRDGHVAVAVVVVVPLELLAILGERLVLQVATPEEAFRLGLHGLAQLLLGELPAALEHDGADPDLLAFFDDESKPDFVAALERIDLGADAGPREAFLLVVLLERVDLVRGRGRRVGLSHLQEQFLLEIGVLPLLHALERDLRDARPFLDHDHQVDLVRGAVQRAAQRDVAEKTKRDELALASAQDVGGERLARAHVERAQDAGRVGECVALDDDAADRRRPTGLRRRGRRRVDGGELGPGGGHECDEHEPARGHDARHEAATPGGTQIHFGHSGFSCGHGQVPSSATPAGRVRARGAERRGHAGGSRRAMMDKTRALVQPAPGNGRHVPIPLCGAPCSHGPGVPRHPSAARSATASAAQQDRRSPGGSRRSVTAS